jgi:uncharacterized protein YecE (DUF72 family)
VLDETTRTPVSRGDVRVGVSGWRYPHWRGAFYPRGLAQRRELAYLAERLPAVEVNASFYALGKPAWYASWAEQTPDGFLFAVKGSRYITHRKKLAGVETALANFLASGLLALGPKLGPILWQLPPSLGFHADRLASFLAHLPRSTAAAADLARRHDDRLAGRALTETDADRPLRHAVEVRHASFAVPEFAALLREHDVALVVADTAGRFPALDDVTSDLVYVRLHGAAELYASGYSDAELDAWAARVERWSGDGHDVVVFFDNDAEGHAPRDALALAHRLGVAGTLPA